MYTIDDLQEAAEVLSELLTAQSKIERIALELRKFESEPYIDSMCVLDAIQSIVEG